ncbi:tyrosine-protein kinase Wzc [Sodalis sp. RH22]|uniref:tyrosine-protein kinase Wzc n=1 Tax=unclassified Sodalis (in: enterobacteria) TaxID=2636512 RepID=UPI0039B63DED
MPLKTKQPVMAKENTDEIDIGRLIGTLIDFKWFIISVTALTTIIGIIVVMFSTPIYKADALVQVETNVGSALVDNVNSLLTSAKPTSDAEIELIQSRLVLGKTVDDLKLNINIQQKYFPIFGRGWARLINENPGQIALSRLNVPSNLQNASLTLKVIDDNHYELYNGNDLILNGQVGLLANQKDFSILISDIKAKPESEFTLSEIPELSAIQTIKNNIIIEDAGKDTGVLELSLTGEDPVLVQKTLDRIAQNYLLQNVERKSQEAEKSLEFLNVQVPKARAELDSAEGKLNLFRQQNDSVDLNLEAKSLLDNGVNLDAQLNELTFKEAEISKLYTKDHPAYRTLLEKRQTLLDEKDKLNKRINSMPQTQQEIIRLTRDMQSAQEIYMQLLNKQQEMDISKASTVGNVRIVDRAVTLPGAVSPRTAIIIAASVLIGLILSSLIILIKSILHKGIENQADLEAAGINVYASIPLSEWQQRKDRERIVSMQRKGSINKQHKANELLAIGNPTDLAIEAVRSLRTSLHFAMLEAKNNIMMVSGASPSIGKTFICTNMAVVIAQSQKRVLLIDADMRKGYTHELLEVDNKNGLSDVLSGQCTFQQSVKSTKVPNFDIITRGVVPPNPSELLMTQKLEELMNWASQNYDLVLIDTPPILAVTDAAIVGHHAGTSMLVARFALTTLKEIEISYTRFEQNGIEIKGVILNSVVKKASNYYGEYGYYNYSYQSANEK